MLIAEALRMLRTRAGLTQTAASKREGAPDHRTLSHWETRRKLPSLKLLNEYLRSLGLDFSDLQEALEQVEGSGQSMLQKKVVELEERIVLLEQQVSTTNGDVQALDSCKDLGSTGPAARGVVDEPV